MLRAPLFPHRVACSAPTTVDLAQQPYRHVDSIRVNCVGAVKSLIDLVSVNERFGLQRGAILYGRYLPDRNFRHGVAAVVDALYEPPQSVDAASGAIRFLEDPVGKKVDEVAAVFGLQPIGWLITRKPTDKAKGVQLLPHELFGIAARQLVHSPRPDGRSGSQWVTLTVFKGDDGNYHLQGYMASDQCMAMVRDNVLAVPKATDVKFRRRQLTKDAPLGTELPVPDILAKDALRGAYRTDEFDPDVCVITMEASAGGSATGVDADRAPVFKHEAFVPANREAFGIRPTPPVDLRAHLRSFPSEPYQARLSDFNALVFISRALDHHTALAAAGAVAKSTPVDSGIQLILEALVAS